MTLTLPSYKQFKEKYSLSIKQRNFIENSRETIRNILNGVDSRLLLILGPCSIHDTEATLAFAKRFSSSFNTISSQFFPIMRAYCEKPRTTYGWKGFLYDPHLDGSYDMATGISMTRQLMLELTELEIPLATEFLDPITSLYYDDLISWGSIGARTSLSQPHRQHASGLKMPIGIKNCVTGSISAAINGVLVASDAHTYLGMNEEGLLARITTPGNRDAHIVLRGGETGPNYGPESINFALKKLELVRLPPRLIVDCSHQNSGKNPVQQKVVFQSMIAQIIEGNWNIKGLMIESHLREGCQILSKDPLSLQFGLSVTDPCLDWESTKQLIQWGAIHLAKRQFIEKSIQATTTSLE